MAVTSHAGLIFDTFVEAPLTLTGTAHWTLSPDPSTMVVYSGTYWNVSLEAKTFSGGSYSYELIGYHVVGPHAGDEAPGDSVDIGAVFPKTVGSLGDAKGKIEHNIVSPNGHLDKWTSGAEVKAGEVDIWFTAAHVPEPSTYAMIAGLGLMGFGIVRRMRRA